MNNGSHIREEDLELYALGALPEAEAAAVKAHVAGCRECAPKLAEARGNIAMLALAAEQEAPSPRVKESLFAKISAEKIAADKASAEAVGRVHERVREALREPKRPVLGWLNWVLIPATAMMAILCVLLYQQNAKLNHELGESYRMAAEFRSERARMLGLVNALSAVDTETIKLASTKDGVAGSAAVVRYNKRLGKVLYTAELPELPQQKVYQMWLVPASGKPISAGTFSADVQNPEPWEAEVPANSLPKAFAVTIEPAGGVPQPTGKIILLGTS